MAIVQKITKSADSIWESILAEIQQHVENEPLLASFLHATILRHSTLEQSLSYHLARKLADHTLSESFLREIIEEALSDDPAIGVAVREDLSAFVDRDPACDRLSLPFLYYKGFHALQVYRIGHWLWQHDSTELALFLQSRLSETWAVDIHPAADIGHGIMIDHATSIVIGETG